MPQAAKRRIEVGLVLQGGGALGAYECGAVTALLELMDEIDIPGRTVALTAVTGVSIGAVNAACIVGAKDRADARNCLRALWNDLALETPSYWWPNVSRDLSLFGLPGFYTPRRDFWGFGTWTHIYDTGPLLDTLKGHVDFDAINASKTAFVITTVDATSGELRRFRNHDHGDEKRVVIQPTHVLASGSLPPGFPWTPIDGSNYWDGGLVDNTPLGDAISAFTGSSDVDRILVVMNLFRMARPLPRNLFEVNDRVQELRFGNRIRQDRDNARNINSLVETVEKLVAVVPDSARDPELEARIDYARRFKVLDAITDIDLADSDLMAEAGLKVSPDDSAGFRDFSVAGINRRRDAGYKLARLKLQGLFEGHRLLPVSH
jgi:NTE family protein